MLILKLVTRIVVKYNSKCASEHVSKSRYYTCHFHFCFFTTIPKSKRITNQIIGDRIKSKTFERVKNIRCKHIKIFLERS